MRFKKANVQLKKGCNIGKGSFFEGHNFVGKNSSFKGFLGFGSYIASESKINGKIGRYCSIAQNVKVVNGFHPTEKIVSTHPYFYSQWNCVDLKGTETNIFEELRFSDKENKFDVIVGNDVWIGANAIILAGVKIGDGAVIAAGAVVTKDVEPYSIVGGVPAKEIRKRFTQEQIDFLLKFKWWDKDEKWLSENRAKFENLEKFIETFDV